MRSHVFGLILSIAGAIALVTVSVLRGTAWHIVSCAVYGAHNGRNLILIAPWEQSVHLRTCSEIVADMRQRVPPTRFTASKLRFVMLSLLQSRARQT
jgi:hypothetical protein